jgi:hypothetical protein
MVAPSRGSLVTFTGALPLTRNVSPPLMAPQAPPVPFPFGASSKAPFASLTA